METEIQGRVFKFGDNINSDIIIPGRYLIYIEPEKLARHAFEVLGEGFAERLRGFASWSRGWKARCRRSSVASSMFRSSPCRRRWGTAREQAVTAIMGLGVKAVVACSFSRTFYRNAINSGLPIVECPEIYDAVDEGDEVRLDLAAGQIHHRETDYSFPKFPDSVRELLELGGLAEYLKAQQKKLG